MQNVNKSRSRAATPDEGFTLVELAIVLVIIGLLLGGVLKGQALIDSARARALSNEVNSIRSAWYAFQERYRAVPGDFSGASTQIDSLASSGNGNGRIDGGDERAGVWQQLSLAGLLNGSFDGAGSASGSSSDLECSESTCPKNPFNGYYKISYSSQAADARSASHEFFTGDHIPVSIIAELDARLDDGRPESGRFRVHRQFQSACTRDGEWDVQSANPDCAGVFRE